MIAETPRQQPEEQGLELESAHQVGAPERSEPDTWLGLIDPYTLLTNEGRDLLRHNMATLKANRILAEERTRHIMLD
jgi:hypothetical protein